LGIKVGTWATQLVESLLEHNRRHGFFFLDKKGKQTKASTFEPSFFELLKWVRASLGLVPPPNVNIEDDFGIPRSCWRGWRMEAANQGIPSKIIKNICT
jgi:hypothetical protein